MNDDCSVPQPLHFGRVDPEVQAFVLEQFWDIKVAYRNPEFIKTAQMIMDEALDRFGSYRCHFLDFRTH